MYCLLLTAFYDLFYHLQNDNNFCNFWLGQISRFILSHYILGGRVIIGGGMPGNNANCFLLKMANLLIFIHNGQICQS